MRQQTCIPRIAANVEEDGAPTLFISDLGLVGKIDILAFEVGDISRHISFELSVQRKYAM